MTPGTIRIKDTQVLHSLLVREFDFTLTVIVIEIATEFGIVITEGSRPARHDGDLHATHPVMAVDARSWCYPKETQQRILDYVNSRWLYDPKRPYKKILVLHKTKHGVYHFHIQTHPGTIRK